MTEHSHLLLAKGRYQLIALTPDEEYQPGDVVAYAVQTTSGARVRHELTVEGARAWMEKLVEEEEAMPRQDLAPPPKKRHVRR